MKFGGSSMAFGNETGWYEQRRMYIIVRHFGIIMKRFALYNICLFYVLGVLGSRFVHSHRTVFSLSQPNPTPFPSISRPHPPLPSPLTQTQISKAIFNFQSLPLVCFLSIIHLLISASNSPPLNPLLTNSPTFIE
jgi:hypothetical protein